MEVLPLVADFTLSDHPDVPGDDIDRSDAYQDRGVRIALYAQAGPEELDEGIVVDKRLGLFAVPGDGPGAEDVHLHAQFPRPME